MDTTLAGADDSTSVGFGIEHLDLEGEEEDEDVEGGTDVNTKKKVGKASSKNQKVDKKKKKR